MAQEEQEAIECELDDVDVTNGSLTAFDMTRPTELRRESCGYRGHVVTSCAYAHMLQESGELAVFYILFIRQ